MQMNCESATSTLGTHTGVQPLRAFTGSVPKRIAQRDRIQARARRNVMHAMAGEAIVWAVLAASSLAVLGLSLKDFLTLAR